MPLSMMEVGRGLIRTRINPLPLLNTIRAQFKIQIKSGLMYIKLVLSGTDVLGMVDIGATHTFISEKMVHSLSINVVQSMCQIKSVNSVGHGYRCGNSSQRFVKPHFRLTTMM